MLTHLLNFYLDLDTDNIIPFLFIYLIFLENKDYQEDIRRIVESVIDSILAMSVEIIEKNKLHLEKISSEQKQLDVVNRLASDYKNLMKCKTGDTIQSLYIPKIQQNPCADNIIDAKNFVEEYEEYHESCSEMQDAEIAISQVMSELSDNVENAIIERQKNKKKKVIYQTVFKN